MMMQATIKGLSQNQALLWTSIIPFIPFIPVELTKTGPTSNVQRPT